jgi:hypothetical protein
MRVLKRYCYTTNRSFVLLLKSRRNKQLENFLLNNDKYSRETFDNKTHLQLNLNRSRKAKTESTKTCFRFDKTACFVSYWQLLIFLPLRGCNLISSKTEKPPHNKQMAMKLDCIGELFGQRESWRGFLLLCL